MKDVDYASLLCSRLCHDLMSPVGALSNAIELLADESDPDMQQQVLELLGDSARGTAAKLKFFRLAFGAAGGYGDEVDTGEAEAAVRGLFSDRKVCIGWNPGDDRLPKGAVKLLLNLAMIAGDALVRGGRLDVGVESAGSTIEMVIRAEGPRVVIDPQIRSVLIDGAGANPLESRAAAAWLANALARDARGTIRLSDPADDLLLIGVTIPL